MTNPLKDDYCPVYADIVAPLAEKFRKKTRTDQEDVVCDMVLFLMHYALRNGQDPEEEIERAISNWSDVIELSGCGGCDGECELARRSG
jgi:hypothetical protein